MRAGCTSESVSVNGIDLVDLPDLSYSAGAPRHWTQVSLRIPEGVLKDGSNTVTVVPAEGEPLMKITSVRLTSQQADDAVLNADRDLDGMTDAWEIEYGFDPADFTDGIIDTDEDGYDNAAEYVCGTDPLDDQSYLSVAGMPEVGAGFKIAFGSESNRLYAVEATYDLHTGWSEMTNGILGGPDLIEIMDAESATNRFYRVKVEVQ